MEVFFIFIISIIIRSADSDTNGSSSSSKAYFVYIFIPIFITIICCVFLLSCLKAKYRKRSRLDVLPLSTQIALAQQENQYGPPSYNQIPPYAQPPPYEQPPPYSPPSAPVEPTNTTIRS
jgi:hypothetical protein